MAIVGPAVENLNTNAFRRNPAATESRLATTARRKKCESLFVSCRAVAEGMMINELANSAPMKRSPTSTVRLKRRRKYRSSRVIGTSVGAAIPAEEMLRDG